MVQKFSCGRLMHTGLNFVNFFTPSRRAHDVVHNMSQYMNPFAFDLNNPVIELKTTCYMSFSTNISTT